MNRILTDLLLIAARNVELIQNKILLPVEETSSNRRNSTGGSVGVTGAPVVVSAIT